MGSSLSVLAKPGVENTDLMLTISRFLFGTSIPIVPLPGIGAMIRMPNADKLSAISSSRFLMREILMPASGTISYSVTVGPIVALML
jgi:hypothetical protein